jgi:trigger factor
LVSRRAHSRLHAFEHELEHRETTLENYLADSNQTREEFEAVLQQEIEQELRQELVLEEIANLQNVEVTQDEVINHYHMMAQMLRQPVEQLVQEVDVETVRASIRQRKAIDWLMEKASVTETGEVAEEQAAEEQSSQE